MEFHLYKKEYPKQKKIRPDCVRNPNFHCHKLGPSNASRSKLKTTSYQINKYESLESIHLNCRQLWTAIDRRNVKNSKLVENNVNAVLVLLSMYFPMASFYTAMTITMKCCDPNEITAKDILMKILFSKGIIFEFTKGYLLKNKWNGNYSKVRSIYYESKDEFE